MKYKYLKGKEHIKSGDENKLKDASSSTWDYACCSIGDRVSDWPELLFRRPIKSKPTITDKQRIDFVERHKIEVSKGFYQKWAISGISCGKSWRNAVDAAMAEWGKK